jgi:ubiquinone/menaquinone biosynthesis C-methylase UbiE
LTQYADRFKVYGIDYNLAMVKTAKRNLDQRGLRAALQQADVCHLPYANGSIDCIVNTMAFSGYPDGHLALTEMMRVLKRGGSLMMIDIYYPGNRNWLGMSLDFGGLQVIFYERWGHCSKPKGWSIRKRKSAANKQ